MISDIGSHQLKIQTFRETTRKNLSNGSLFQENRFTKTLNRALQLEYVVFHWYRRHPRQLADALVWRNLDLHFAHQKRLRIIIVANRGIPTQMPSAITMELLGRFFSISKTLALKPSRLTMTTLETRLAKLYQQLVLMAPKHSALALQELAWCQETILHQLSELPQQLLQTKPLDRQWDNQTMA